MALSADWPVCCRGQRSTRHQSRESKRAAHQLVHVSLIISFVYKNLFIFVIASLFPFLLFDHTDMAFPPPPPPPPTSPYSSNHLICSCLKCLYVGVLPMSSGFLNKQPLIPQIAQDGATASSFLTFSFQIVLSTNRMSLSKGVGPFQEDCCGLRSI